MNRLQNLRKDEGLELDDRIRLQLAASGELADAIREHWALTREEVLCLDEEPPLAEEQPDCRTFDIDGTGFAAGLEKA